MRNGRFFQRNLLALDFKNYKTVIFKYFDLSLYRLTFAFRHFLFQGAPSSDYCVGATKN